MSRPTITLAMIAKNEEKNINRLLDSVEGCFDEIVLVDTGSSDRTKEIASSRGCQVFDFEWVNSFSKARNFAFSKATCDYIMWMDLDDVLAGRENFIKWRNHAMQFSDMSFATYNYALDQDGKPIVSFVRERVFKRSIFPTWQYDLHEGIVAKPEWSRDYAVTWSINHMRDMEDIKADKSRNILILEGMRSNFDARMQFYYGKELYEANRCFEAALALELAVQRHDIETHDKILSLQYGVYAATQCAEKIGPEYLEDKQKYFTKALDFAHQGIKLDPSRAEFYVGIGDIYLKLGQLPQALPYYGAAKSCIHPKQMGSPYEGAIYSFVNCYGELPSLQMAKIYFNLGHLDESKKEAEDCLAKYQSVEAKTMLQEIERVQSLVRLDHGQEPSEDIVISCPPQSAYPFDEELYETKGMGGSETALIEMAKHLKEKTGRRVLVFNMRETELTAKSGVEYIPNRKLHEYLSVKSPKAHIAWRHNIKITNAKTYLWCHDLITPSVESQPNFDKILCLSEFHKNYVQGKQGLSDDQILVTRNGISPEKFKFHRKHKNPNKIVWMSSPDRGLDRAMHVCDEIIKTHPNIELHVYYGLDNLVKYGLGALAEKLKTMMSERAYVKYHGFTEQSKMYHEVSDAVLWLHPCNFIETFCITALEMLALGIFPVTRKLGALANTLAEAEAGGQAILLDHDCVTAEEIKAYADAAMGVLETEQWKAIQFDIDKHSWDSVASEWIQFMEI